MRTGMTIKAAALLLAALLAAPVVAHPGGMWHGPGMWNGGWHGGMGYGPGMGQGMGSGMGYGPGMGPGMGRGAMMAQGGGMRFNEANTPGWALMTPEERTEQQKKMRAVTTYDECRKLQAEHRSLIEARAKEKGVTLVPPRRNACDMMKARGLIS